MATLHNKPASGTRLNGELSSVALIKEAKPSKDGAGKWLVLGSCFLISMAVMVFVVAYASHHNASDRVNVNCITNPVTGQDDCRPLQPKSEKDYVQAPKGVAPEGVGSDPYQPVPPSANPSSVSPMKVVGPPPPPTSLQCAAGDAELYVGGVWTCLAQSNVDQP